MKLYKANKKGFIRYLLIIVLAFPFIIFFLDSETISEKPFILLPLLGPAGLIAWLYLDTWYKIEDRKLKYKAAFMKGEIEVDSIREITTNTAMWSGIKPALATNGLIIKYNKYDEVYLAPENNTQLITDLLDLNRSIKVI